MLSRCLSEMQDLVDSCCEHCGEMALAAGPSLRAASAEENKVKVKLLPRASLCPTIPGRDGPGSCPNLDLPSPHSVAGVPTAPVNDWA